MKITPEISFTLESTEDEVNLILDKFNTAYLSLRFDGWKDSFEMFAQKLVENCCFSEFTTTLTLKEAKELVEDIADAGLCDEFKELWSALWNAIKGY
jgi:hypothetical protein